MNDFAAGHGTHPDWRMALSMAAAQVDSQLAPQSPPTLGFVYFSDHFANQAEALLGTLRQRWPGVVWAGSVGVGVLASGVEYFDEPALVLLLAGLPRDSFRVFSGAMPLAGFDAFSALVHADPATPDLDELLLELSQRTESGYLFGGLASSRHGVRHLADGVWQGALSGVAFTQGVTLVSRVTQGCQPIGPVRRITAAEQNRVLALDGEPALRCLLRDLDAGADEPRTLLPKLHSTLVGLSEETEELLGRGAMFGADTRVRHLVGVDPAHEVVAVADHVRLGMRLAFCHRDAQAARRDLVRICSEIREELSPDLDRAVVPTHGGAHGLLPAVERPPGSTEGERILGALYISCAGRGGPHFGAPSAEAQILRRALGDVPLAGFFAGGEIARHHLYGYTGVLTVFVGG